MTYDPNIDSGYTHVKSWVQVPSGIFSDIDQSNEYDNAGYPDRTARNYAQMVYQINSTPITGEISVDSVGLNGDGDVGLSGDNLKVIDTQSIDTLNNIEAKLSNIESKRYSSITKISGDYTYIMMSEIGSGLSGDPVWRISRLYDDGTTMVLDWADGNDDFDNIAADYLVLSYSL